MTQRGSKKKGTSGPSRMPTISAPASPPASEDPVRAIDSLLKAAACYDEAQMPLRAHLLRYRLAEIQSGPETRALHDKAEQWLKAQGIVAPARWAGMYAPGFAKIAGESVETTF